jgi:hypothetical protein
MTDAATHAERCRNLLAQATKGTLSTIARDPAGFPYGSLVAIAVDAAGRPLLLLSKLAEHTHNLEARPEASVLVTGEGADGDPLAGPRVSVVGRCASIPSADVADARARFLARHPEAARYADFKDFGFFRLEPVALRYVEGFGRMSWVEPAAYAAAWPQRG